MTTRPLTQVMKDRLCAIAAEPDGVLTVEQPNWNHMTDKALRRRGLVHLERVMSWWRISITDAGRAERRRFLGLDGDAP